MSTAFLMVMVVACGALSGKEQADVQRYAWLPTESAPADAPIFFLRGDLALADGKPHYIPDHRVAAGGWGMIGSTHIVGDDVKALPRQASLSWFSYTEDRFFAAQIALPTDRVATMMDRGAPMPPPQQRQRYDRILFGMAPGGNVSVWLSAGPVVTELATFRAAPSDVPFTEIVKNPATTRQAHIQRVLEDRLGADALDALRARPERLLAWNDYPRRLAWTAQLVGATPQGAILWYKGVNGEKDWFDLADPTRGGEPLPALLPMPASLTLAWRSPAGGLSADITLDPDESVAAFRKLSGSDRPGPMTLMLEPSGTGDTVDVFLRRGDLVYRFKNTKVQVFGGS